MAFASAEAFRRLKALELFGEFDGGTFARLHETVFPATDRDELLGPRMLSDAQIRDIVAAHYSWASHAARRDRVLVLVKPLTKDDLRAAAGAFAVGLGIELPAGFAPSSIAAVADAIQNQLVLARRVERLWAVNDTAPFFIVRDHVDDEYGAPWQPPRPMLSRFADLVRGEGSRVDVIERHDVDNVAVHVCISSVRDSSPDGVSLVTDGFRNRVLGTYPELARFELTTFAWREDAKAVAARLVALGNALYTRAPISPDEVVALGGVHYLVSAFGGPQMTFEGEIDFARVTPVAVDESVGDDASELLDALGLAGAMDRWAREV